ncbi:MAG: hypothetical protein WC197_03665 [Candidatus Gastranaerophilaceae bacterium]|jgi:hypothetical protein
MTISLSNSFKFNYNTAFKGTDGDKSKHIVANCDTYDTKAVDLNKDELSDVSHGFLTWLSAHKTRPDYNILNFKIKNYFAKDKCNIQGMVNGFQQIADRIKSDRSYNKKTIEAVNTSLSINMSFKDLTDLVREKLSNSEITPDNIKAHSEKLRNLLTDEKEWPNSEIRFDKKVINVKDLKDLLEALESITKLGIPVFTAAGNEKSDHFSLFSLAKGVTTVGALDSDGKAAKYSASHSLVSAYEDGSLHIKPVKNGDYIMGFSVLNGNDIDIPVKMIAGCKMIGKPVSEALATEDDYNLINSKLIVANFKKTGQIDKNEALLLNQGNPYNLANKVFDVEKLGKLYKLTPDLLKNLKEKCDYADSNLKFLYKTDSKGKLQLVFMKGMKYLPDNNGTSYSSPIFMMKYLTKPQSFSKSITTFCTQLFSKMLSVKPEKESNE